MEEDQLHAAHEAVRLRLTAEVDARLQELEREVSSLFTQARADAEREFADLAHGPNHEAVAEAHAVERQEQLAVVDRLWAAVREISDARTLNGALAALAQGVSVHAPRSAVFTISNDRLTLWQASGLADAPAELATPSNAAGILEQAARQGSAVPTGSRAAPAFAKLPPDRAGLAVPIIVGGTPVGVVYADDGTVGQREAPASWPEAVQLLCCHASAHLGYVTAARTGEALGLLQSSSSPRQLSMSASTAPSERAGLRRSSSPSGEVGLT